MCIFENWLNNIMFSFTKWGGGNTRGKKNLADKCVLLSRVSYIHEFCGILLAYIEKAFGDGIIEDIPLSRSGWVSKNSSLDIGFGNLG